ncbi:MAG: response regulator [Selenomonadaceae bacterium]|nr:response regulator [Selenomonadaceae bacterium]MBR4695644.1 response regulator [Selenomonadaceae bacterium]
MIKTVIVEDDMMVASINRTFAMKIAELDIVAMFRNGQEALEFLQENPAELLLLDIYVPGLSGLELLSELRRQGNAVEAILITADNGGEDVEHALHLGIVDYLVKPFTYERFHEAMQKFLVRHSLKEKGTYTQSDIDQLMHVKQLGGGQSNAELEKGIQRQTLDRILGYLEDEEQKAQYRTCEQLAKETGLSKVTVRRYMNYLIEQKQAVSRVNYSTGGRPSIEYKLIASG